MSTDSPQTGSAKKRGLRFSLLNLFALLTFSALAITVWKLNAELVPLRQEVRELRNETGQLTIDDPRKFYAIRVSTDESETWKYRVWVPEGPQYWLWNARSAIPSKGIAQQGSGGTIEPGEHRIEVVLKEDETDKNQLKMIVLVDGEKRMSSSVQERQLDWIENDEVGGRVASRGGVELETESFPPPGPVVLLRYRGSEVTNIRRNAAGKPIGHSWKTPDGPTDGVMLWIEPRRGN